MVLLYDAKNNVFQDILQIKATHVTNLWQKMLLNK